MAKPPSALSPYKLHRAGSRLSQKYSEQQQQPHQIRCFRIHSNLQAFGVTRMKKVSPGKGTPRTKFEDLKPTDLAVYWDTEPPVQPQLEAAERFFAPSRHSPVKLFSAAQFRTMPFDSKEPEVAFLGRANVGKSSLINAVLGEEICWASATPGRTREMNAFGIGGTKGGESKIVLLDMPGYGKGSRSDQGTEIMKYLQNRKQCVSLPPRAFCPSNSLFFLNQMKELTHLQYRLRRTYLLIDPLHGLKDSDAHILSLLRRYAIPHQIVISKVDRILADKLKTLKSLHTDRVIKDVRLVALQKMFEKIRPTIQPAPSQGDGPGALGEILSCCAASRVTKFMSKSHLGINALRWSILKATGFDGTVQAEDIKSTTVQPPPEETEETEERTKSIGRRRPLRFTSSAARKQKKE